MYSLHLKSTYHPNKYLLERVGEPGSYRRKDRSQEHSRWDAGPLQAAHSHAEAYTKAAKVNSCKMNPDKHANINLFRIEPTTPAMWSPGAECEHADCKCAVQASISSQVKLCDIHPLNRISAVLSCYLWDWRFFFFVFAVISPIVMRLNQKLLWRFIGMHMKTYAILNSLPTFIFMF